MRGWGSTSTLGCDTIGRGLGVPEVWVIHRDTKVPEIFVFTGRMSEPAAPDADGWFRSAATPVMLRATSSTKLASQLSGEDGSYLELPEE